jgi:repressor LexA
MNLTMRQKEVYSFLKEYFERYGTAPSYDEIRLRLGLSSLSTVHKYLKHLEKKGFIHSPWASQKRALSLTEHGEPTINIPLLGYVAAGKPIEAVETPDQIYVPPALLQGGECFALRVKGDSMIEEGIHDGDTILVKKQETAENGQTVVALIDGEATVKKFYLTGDKIELRPANAAMKPIIVDAGSVKIQGILIGLMRRYK